MFVPGSDGEPDSKQPEAESPQVLSYQQGFFFKKKQTKRKTWDPTILPITYLGKETQGQTADLKGAQEQTKLRIYD